MPLIMSTKITRKDALDILSKYAFGIDEKIVNAGCVPDVKLLTSRSYVDKGERVEEYYCQNCGSVHRNLARPYYYSRHSTTCPSCGNTNYTGGHVFEPNGYNLYVDEHNGGFKFVLYKISYRIASEDANWWWELPTSNVDVRYVGCFDDENGWYVYDVGAVKLIGRNSTLEQDVLNRVKGIVPVNKSKGDFDVMLAKATVYEAQKAAANEVRRANSKATLLTEMRDNHKAKSIDVSMIADSAHTIMYDVYSTKDDKIVYQACCTKCGKVFEVERTRTTDEEDEGSLVKCPNCDVTNNITCSYGYHRSNTSERSSVVVFENTNLPENDLLIRVFARDRYFSLKDGFKQEVVERQRIFCGKKVNVYSRSYKYATKAYGDFEKVTVRDIDDSLVGWHRDGQIVQSEEEIVQIIKNSCLVHSGLIESYGLGDKRYKPYEAAPSLKYLMAWYKKPAIELILKSNMTTIMEHMIREPERIGVGKTLADALQVVPSVAKIATKLNLDYTSLGDLSALHNADNNITAEAFLTIKQLGLPTFQMAQLKNVYNIDYAQTIKYMDTVYNHQCIERREALTLWVDYLRMATALHIDLTDKSRLYPGSLKKEHDVATFAYRAIQIEVDKERFREQAERNAYFEYTYKDLLVVVPKTPQEIVEEATRQKNCLRSYVESVKEGRTVVVFIRRKIMPDATYVTAEVNNGRLVQLKGYCNSNPRNKELVEFVQHWSKAKGIRVEC